LHSGLAAGQSHSTPVFVKWSVPHYLAEDLAGTPLLADPVDGAGWAILDPDVERCGPFLAQAMAVPFLPTGGTGFFELPADDAVVAEESQLRLQLLGLRIGAPVATKGTAFEEDVGSQAGSIVQGIALNIENDAFDLLQLSPFLKGKGPRFKFCHDIQRIPKLAVTL
jgi:hypothetical protein